MASDNAQWLMYDRRKELGGKPGTHALVIGVSAYRYLPSETDKTDSPRSFGLRRLWGAASAAYVFQNWLHNNADKLAAPLKTLRLLLTPDQAEVDEIDDLDRSQAKGSFNNMVSAVYAWREDAAYNPEDATVFYFCGNGFDLGH